jgi:threonine-phosphate decarboxylase
LNKHKHGGRVFEAAADLGLPWQDILDFSANINPLGQPPGLKEHLFENFPATIHYPDVDASNLVSELSSQTGLPPEAILPGAGSTPHIRMLARFFRPKRPLIMGPAFAEYEESLLAASLKPLHIYAREKDGFLPQPKSVDEIGRLEPDLVFLANPANPTGRLAPEETIEALLGYARRSKATLVIDEAFIDFTRRGSIQEEVLRNPGLIILRSLTKVFAVPGLRLAYLAANPRLCKAFKAQMEPWPINFMALEAGIYSLRLKSFMEGTAAETERLRPVLQKALSPWGGLTPSDANFVLMKVHDPDKNKEKIVHGLYREGILVRDASNFRGLKEGFLRFAVRPEQEIKRLSQALEGIRA